MHRALMLARKAGQQGEVPVGAVIVKDGKVIAEGYNRREEKQDALSHAETEAIHNACMALHSWRLDGCELYVTLEPCPMCTGAIINARIGTVVFGAYDPKAGSMDSVVALCHYPFEHKPEIYGGILEEECLSLLQDFFRKLR